MQNMQGYYLSNNELISELEIPVGTISLFGIVHQPKTAIDRQVESVPFFPVFQITRFDCSHLKWQLHTSPSLRFGACDSS